MSYKTPLISIVMLNYNGLKYLKRTIPPILKLDYPNYEFIIIDNGSTDGSIEFIKNFKEIKLIKSPKLREKNFACNYAIDRAKGEFIFLMDNDALITQKDLLKDLIIFYKNNNNVGVIGLSYNDEGNKSSKSYGSYLGYYFIKEQKEVKNDDIKKVSGTQIVYPEGKGFLIKKSIWKELGGYDDHLIFGGDDNDLGIKLWLMGYKNYLYSKTIQIHLGLPERQDNKKYKIKFKEMFYAHLYTIVKDYRLPNMFITLIGLTIFSFLKSIKQSVFRLNFGPFFAFFKGYYLFLKNLSIALQKRKEIQLKRVVKEDIFLKIKPPKFN